MKESCEVVYLEVDGLKIHVSGGKEKLGGVWTSLADVFLPGRQRGLEGGEPARGNSWERRRLGLANRGSLFPSELIGFREAGA